MDFREIRIEPEIGIKINGESFNYKLFESLESLSRTYSQRKTAKELHISHSVLNRRIKNAEDKLGEPLVITVGSGSQLSEKAMNCLTSITSTWPGLKTGRKS